MLARVFTRWVSATRGKRGVAQVGSASGLGPEGRRFKSCHPDSQWKARALENSTRARAFRREGPGRRIPGRDSRANVTPCHAMPCQDIAKASHSATRPASPCLACSRACRRYLEPMKLLRQPRLPITAFDSRGVSMDFLPQVDGATRTRVHVATIEAGGTIGSHPAPTRQAFAVQSGVGEVVTDGRRSRLGPGDLVVWEPGEVHQTWAHETMTVVIVETDGQLDTTDFEAG